MEGILVIIYLQPN